MVVPAAGGAGVKPRGGSFFLLDGNCTTRAGVSSKQAQHTCQDFTTQRSRAFTSDASVDLVFLGQFFA